MGKSKNKKVNENSARQSYITDTKPKIINLSNHTLTDSEVKLLSKGLKFCPTPVERDLLELEVNMKELARKIELQVFMSNSKFTKADYLLSRTGLFIPPESKEKLLNSVITKIISEAESLENLAKPNVFKNLSIEECKALSQLKNNSNIIVRPFDKGSGICILDRDWYITKITNILNTNPVYKQLSKNVDTTVVKELNNLIIKHNHCFDQRGKEKDYLINFDFQTANFYGNPKIHKCTVIKDIIKSSNTTSVKIDIGTVDLPFRCITAGKTAPLCKLSELLDTLLKPFLLIIPSYIRDAVDFINKLPKVEPADIDDILIVSCDVKDMYNNIKQPLGLRSADYWLSKFPELLHHRFTKEFILDSLQLILSNANFQFNDQFYTLSTGTVTGTTVSPIYANLTMAYLEILLYQKVGEKYGETVEKYVTAHWKRFLDDGHILWRKSFGPISEFVDLLNSLDKDITFTHECSDTGLPFLQVYVYKSEGKIMTDVYYKETDNHDYLPFSSCHPRHTLENIPFNLARNICTLVDDPERKEFRLNELKNWLRKGGYKPDLVNFAFFQAKSLDQISLRSKVVKEPQEKLTFITTHNPHNPHVFGEIVKNFEFLKSSNKYKNIFAKVRIIKSERQSKNLYRHLVHSNVVKPKFEPGCTKCGNPRCGTCPYLLESKSISFHNAGAVFTLKNKFDCLSGGVIYKISCMGCDEYYLGLTIHLRNRVTKHKSDLYNYQNRNMKVHKHIFDCAGIDGTPFKIIPFFKVNDPTPTRLQATEDYFVRKFKPSLNTRKVEYS